MSQNDATSIKGMLLIAMPGLLDPNFHQTVVCISEHTAEGAVGTVINRVHSSLTAENIFSELEMDHRPETGQAPIHLGGPVHVSELFILHGPPFDAEASLVITPHLALSTTRDVLQRIAWGKGPESYLITLGCAGWGPGQIETEIRQNAWLTCDITEEIVFRLPLEKRWEAAMRQLGIDPAQLMGSAGHA